MTRDIESELVHLRAECDEAHEQVSHYRDRAMKAEVERAELEIDRNDWKRISDEAEARAEAATEMCRRITTQVDELAKQRVERNAETKQLREELERAKQENRDLRQALARIATERERVPVKHKTGVSGKPRFVHPVAARVIAENALGYPLTAQEWNDAMEGS